MVFADNKLEEAFNSLSDGDWLKKAVRRAIDNLKENAFCGERIKKELIPKIYISKFNIDTLYWYPLPNAWRFLYSVIALDKEKILTLIIEYMDHKDYERRFNY